MADSFGPMDGHDWAEAQWFRHVPAWAPSGVYGTDPASAVTSGDLAFTSSGLNVTIGTGRATVAGAGFERTGSPSSQAVTTNGNATLARRDRIVLRRDLGAHTVAPALIQGTASASPTAPAITRSSTVWDLPLFSFLVPANNGTSITSVQDERTWVSPDSGQLVLPYKTNSGSFTSGSSAEVLIADGDVDLTMTFYADPLYAYQAVLPCRVDVSTAGADAAIRWRVTTGTSVPGTGSTAIGGMKVANAGGEAPDQMVRSLPFVVTSPGLRTVAPFVDTSAGGPTVSGYGALARLDAWIEIVGAARSTHLAV